ncbi:MAG: Mur ligase family protein [Acidimicrobiales bacterium]
MSASLTIVSALALALAYATQMSRWLRVTQREHYDASALPRFLLRWSMRPLVATKRRSTWFERCCTPSFVMVLVAGGALVARSFLVFYLICALYGIVCPLGLSVRGRTSRLEWTRRLRSLAATALVYCTLVSVLVALTPWPLLGLALVVLFVPGVLAVSLLTLQRSEDRRARKFVDQAARRLELVAPRVVAITGSYGKTSTKHHLRELLGDDDVLASPRSFNNRAGLSRAINENLTEGTRIFIAEMGTYGPGEIRELTSWCRPDIAVVTAIGPVHLERMKSLDVVEAAKREITEVASTVVLNIDDPRLSTWPESLQRDGKLVRTAGSLSSQAYVRVQVVGTTWALWVDGLHVGTFNELVGVQPTNVACALAVALNLGVDVQDLLPRISRITPVANRLNVVSAPSGTVVIDDTFNANPASARAALAVLSSLDLSGRRVVVTPGLVELGARQAEENQELARLIAGIPAEMIVVGRTNLTALASEFTGEIHCLASREKAVTWVRASLGAGDAVLYLNDLPDHYP